MRLLLAMAFVLFAAHAHAAPIDVDGGKIEGKEVGQDVEGWFGVPFAKPPLRDLRWRAPQPVESWRGVYHAVRFAPMCVQAMRSRTMNHYFGNEAISEDCLYLNIWAPKKRKGKKLPVIVWIYGGGFNVGSASMANYSGESLASKGAVYVSIAYRVGPLGFLAHPELTREGGGHSGNYGLMDQIAGLEWVQRNIAAFGGDPDNVTIMGQSAGSMSVSLLQISPEARGLFHRIVGMSGSAHGRMIEPAPLEAAERQGLELQTALQANSIEGMRDIAGDKILAAAAGLPRSPIVLDGAVITGAAQKVFQDQQHADTPVMVGYTRDERFANLGPASTVAEYETAVRKAFPETSGAVLNAYPAEKNEDVPRAMVDLMRDMSVGKQMLQWAFDATVNGSSDAYGYFFTRRQPYAEGVNFIDHDPETVGAYHTGDVPYWLGTLDSVNLFRETRDWTEMDRDLAETMQGMIIQFAKTGRPAPEWPAFDPDAPQLMKLGESVEVIPWPNASAMPLFDASPALEAPRRAPGEAGTPRD